MNKAITKEYFDLSGIKSRITHFSNLPTICPFCGQPAPLDILSPGRLYFDDDCVNLAVFALHYTCCNKCAAGHFTVAIERATFFEVSPKEFIGKHFEEDILELSPDFVKIYNQALHAEAMKLDEIAGIGYRKAFEFLVKDFFIRVNPAEKDKNKIIETALSKFFSDKDPSEFKLKNETLNKLALASAWIGNEFAHYYRKHEEYDVSDLKELINATINQICVELFTLEKAEKILGKRKA